MKFNSSIINQLFAITLLITSINIWSMIYSHLLYKDMIKNHQPIHLKLDHSNHKQKSYKKQAEEAAKYNRNNAFLSLPNNILYLIFSHYIDNRKSLENIVKPILALSTICKKLTPLLFPKIIRLSCQSYSIKTKDSAMKNLLASINDFTYQSKRETALFLIHAGANPNQECLSLLSEAVIYNDKQMVAALFKHNANPNQKHFGFNHPSFWLNKNIDIVKMFINQKANLNAPGNHDFPNAIWTCIIQGYSFELIKFYLSHNIDLTTKNYDNDCLLHCLIDSINSYSNFTKYLQLATLLLNTAPEIINTIGKTGKTPLDNAYNRLDRYKNLPTYHATYLQLIELFKKYGGKTAQELQNIDKVENENNNPIHKNQDELPTCCICYENSDDLKPIPCINTHPDQICLECYNKLCLKLCPLCRTELNKYI